jgi:hypothetical protein
MEKKIKASGKMLPIAISVLLTLMFAADVRAGNAGGARTILEVSIPIVTGKVLDEKGSPLAGVSVSEKGTKNGVVTDANGNYRIQVSADNAVLLFSYVGYNLKTEALSGRSTLNVTLEPKSTAISEIIVTALGIKRARKRNNNQPFNKLC